MRKTVRLPPMWKGLTLVALIAIGCRSSDERIVELSRESAERRAEQNRLVETNNRQVLEATTKLVEADAKSRTENIELHRQIEVERSGVNQERDALEQERRQIAAERNRDPIVAGSIGAAAGLIAAILPLLVCLVLLRELFHKPDREALAEILIEDLVSSTRCSVSLPPPLCRENAAIHDCQLHLRKSCKIVDKSHNAPFSALAFLPAARALAVRRPKELAIAFVANKGLKMNPSEVERAVARVTGESRRFVKRFGFSLVADEPECRTDPSLAIDCPGFGAVLNLHDVRNRSCEFECPRCDAVYPIAADELYAVDCSSPQPVACA